MKIIISHDIDHLTFYEHLTDTYIPKFWIRNTAELLARKISVSEWLGRFKPLFTNRLNQIEALMDFDKQHQVNSTFFIGMNNGLGLSYSYHNARKMILKISNNGFETGVHGIEFENQVKMKEEFDKFSQIVGHNRFGIRMHYLRQNADTEKNLAQIGYLYDSTRLQFAAPYQLGTMYQFPLQMMDSGLLYQTGRLPQLSLSELKRRTLDLIHQAEQQKLPYLTILFHDIYFSDNFASLYYWYRWLIEHLSRQKYQFINYQTAINELSVKK